MKFVYVVFILVTAPFVLGADTGVLSGRVTDTSEGAPVAQAYVLVHRSGTSGTDVHVPVKRDGSFATELPSGFYDVLVTAVGFAPTASKVEISAGRTTTYNPRIGMSELESRETASVRNQFDVMHTTKPGTHMANAATAPHTMAGRAR